VRRTTSIVVATGPLLPSAAGASPGEQATPLQNGQVLMAGGTLYDHPSAGHPGVFMVLSSAELYTP